MIWIIVSIISNIINQRKSELTVEEIIMQYEAYETNLLNTNYKIIDTGSGINQSFNETVLTFLNKWDY